MWYLCHEFCEEVHPCLKIYVTLHMMGSWEVIKAWSEWCTLLNDAIMPAKYHCITVSLGIHKPLVPSFQLLPIFYPKLLYFQHLMLIQVVKSQKKSWWITITDIFLHESWTAAKLLPLLPSILLSRNPPVLKHCIEPTFNNF